MFIVNPGRKLGLVWSTTAELNPDVLQHFVLSIPPCFAELLSHQTSFFPCNLFLTTCKVIDKVMKSDGQGFARKRRLFFLLIMQLVPRKRPPPFQPWVLLLAAELWLQAVTAGPNAAVCGAVQVVLGRRGTHHGAVPASSASPGAGYCSPNPPLLFG